MVNNSLLYITTASRATFRFAAGLPIGSKAFLGGAAPMNSTGKRVLTFAQGLIIHLLVPEIPARNLELGRCLRFFAHTLAAASNARFTATFAS